MQHESHTHDYAPRSYVVDLVHDGTVRLRPTLWQPGYTKAHCSTPAEAIAIAEEMAELAMTTAQYHLDALQALRQENK